MSEQRYCYKKVALPGGKFGYERVPYDPNDKFLEPPTIVPRLAPMFKNGEFPGEPSAMVEDLMRKTFEGVVMRHRKELEEACARDNAQDVMVAKQRLNKALTKAGKELDVDDAPAPIQGPSRVLEP